MDILRVVAVILSLFSLGSCLSVEILRPKFSLKPEAALVLVPGAHIKGHAYKPLAESIQDISDFKLWVALIDGFFDHLPNPLQFPSAFKKALAALVAEGYKGKGVFLGGHSLGGAMAAEFSEEENAYLDGVVLFSAYPLEPLQRYPLPVLTISGDLDGLTRVTKIANTFENLQRLLRKHEDQKYKTPVIVLEGVNHGLVASGIMPSNVRNHDLAPELCETAAHEELAKYTNAFMTAVKNETKLTDVDAALTILDTGYTMTSDLMQPLLNIKALDQNEEWISHWTNTAQQLVVSLKNTTLVQFVNYEDETQVLKTLVQKENPNVSFMDSEDENDNGNDTQVTIQSHTTLKLPMNTDGPNPVSPIQLKAVMTSQEAVKKLLPNSTFGTPLTCKDINQEAFILAFFKASNTAKDRFSSRGNQITFLDDYNTTSEINWLLSSLTLNYTDSGLYVRSIRLHTALRKILPGLAGQNSCYLLSPYRAMEYIYIDSLKSKKPFPCHNSTSILRSTDNDSY